jgi:hypothetical protein
MGLLSLNVAFAFGAGVVDYAYNGDDNGCTGVSGTGQGRTLDATVVEEFFGL